MGSTPKTSPSLAKMIKSPHAWCYYSDWYHLWNELVSHAGNTERVCIPSGTNVKTGSKFTVALAEGTVTFVHDGREVHSFSLPEGCGRISLGVSGCDATVSLL